MAEGRREARLGRGWQEPVDDGYQGDLAAICHLRSRQPAAHLPILPPRRAPPRRPRRAPGWRDPGWEARERLVLRQGRADLFERGQVVTAVCAVPQMYLQLGQAVDVQAVIKIELQPISGLRAPHQPSPLRGFSHLRSSMFRKPAPISPARAMPCARPPVSPSACPRVKPSNRSFSKAARPEELRLDRADGHAHHFSHFLIAEILQMAQDQHGAVLWRQVGDLGAHGFTHLLLGSLRMLRADDGGRALRAGKIPLTRSRGRGVASVGLRDLQAVIIRDAIHPSGKARIAAKTAQPLPCR